MGLFVKKEKRYNDDVNIQRKALFEVEDPELAELALAGLDCDQLPNSRGEFGNFFRNPIITNGIQGTLIYLSKLVVARTKTGLIFHRLGSIKNSLTNVGSIDIYEVMDETGTHWDILFVDMFHPRRTNLTPNAYYLKDYDYDLGDSNKSFGTVRTCDNFPYRIVSSLIASGNSRYAIVEEILNNLDDRGVILTPPEEHRKKVETIRQILEQQEKEDEE